MVHGIRLLHWRSLLDLRRVALPPIIRRELKIHILRARRQFRKLNVVEIHAILRYMVAVAETRVPKSLLFLLLLPEEETASNIALQIVISLLMPSPLADGADARLHILQFLQYLLQGRKTKLNKYESK